MGKQKNISIEQREKYKEQARIRAGSRVGRLVKENKLSKMWTLTYAAEQENRTQALIDFKNFIKRLSYQLDRKINYVAVVEVQKDREKDTGKKVLHFHLALEGYYIDKHYLQDIWGHGVVWYSKYKDGKPIRGKKSVAGYLSKYIKKDMAENPNMVGKKLYLNSQGLKMPKTGYGNMSDREQNELEKVSKKFKVTDDITGYELDTNKLPAGIIYTGEESPVLVN